MRMLRSDFLCHQFLYFIDDSYKLLSQNLKENQQHPRYSVLIRLCWSKNINEEQDYPDHILIGVQNMSYCILIVLLTLLELFISKEHTENTDFAFGIHSRSNPNITKENAANFIKRIINEYSLSSILEGKRGNNIIRKMATTKARICGFSKDETNTIYRWKQIHLLFVRGYQFITKLDQTMEFQRIES